MRKYRENGKFSLLMLSLFRLKYLVGSSFCTSLIVFTYFCARLSWHFLFTVSAQYNFVVCHKNHAKHIIDIAYRSIS